MFFIILETGMWSMHDIPTDIIRPLFGHSSAYDPVRGVIYTHGGFVEGQQTNELATALTSYDPIKRTWYVLNINVFLCM